MDRHHLKRKSTWTRRLRRFVLIAGLLLVSVAVAIADPAPPAGVAGNDKVAALALHWFTQMQAGQIDRSQYTAGYAAQLTDTAVQAMSQHLNQYGASPMRAEIVQSRTIERQTFYMVKFVFPRGDASGVLFGFDPEGKISAVGVASMAGD